MNHPQGWTPNKMGSCLFRPRLWLKHGISISDLARRACTAPLNRALTDGDPSQVTAPCHYQCDAARQRLELRRCGLKAAHSHVFAGVAPLCLRRTPVCRYEAVAVHGKKARKDLIGVKPHPNHKDGLVHTFQPLVPHADYEPPLRFCRGSVVLRSLAAKNPHKNADPLDSKCGGPYFNR
jgi:hypothetical protein